MDTTIVERRLKQTTRIVTDEDGSFALNAHRGHIYRLNACGSLIMEGVRAGLGSASIADNMRLAFSIDAGCAISDLCDFFGQTDELGLTEVTP